MNEVIVINSLGVQHRREHHFHQYHQDFPRKERSIVSEGYF
jgi:hypothetical protein